MSGNGDAYRRAVALLEGEIDPHGGFAGAAEVYVRNFLGVNGSAAFDYSKRVVRITYCKDEIRPPAEIPFDEILEKLEKKKLECQQL